MKGERLNKTVRKGLDARCFVLSDVMNLSGLLVPESLQETVYRLEEVRRGFRTGSNMEVKKALDWVLGRQGQKGSYRGLFAPTEKDLSEGLQTLTGERYPGRGALTRHVLGEEALRAVILWNRKSHPMAVKALNGFEEMVNGHTNGFYCCYNCTPAFLRTLSTSKLNGWDEILDKGISNIKKARAINGRWRGFPFYYMLLALSEMDLPSAKDELRFAGKTAQKLVGKYKNKNDRVSRFKTVGLEAAINAL
jgi:hypothetical protein